MDVRQNVRAACDFWRSRTYCLKPYLIRDGKKHPFAIICPGGGYSMVCSFVEGAPYAEQLNKLGYAAFVLYYHCGRGARYPAPMDDLARAISEIFRRADEWGVETQGYSVWGSSAGGHLAASFGTPNMGYLHYGLPKPAALVLAYPVVTMGERSHDGSRKNLLGRGPSRLLVEQTSVEKHVHSNYPPVFLWYGEDDKIVDPANSRMLCRSLASNGVPYEIDAYPGVGHGVGLGTGTACEKWFGRAVHFWEKNRVNDGGASDEE